MAKTKDEQNDFSSIFSLIGVTGLEHQRTVESNVTLAWGVNWNDDAVARDLLQNFYDANRENVDMISIVTLRDQVEISAPATFDLTRLYFLGSEKDQTNVGQYGEGFKAAAVSYLREPNRLILAVSNDQAVVIVPSEQPIAGTKLIPLVYHFFSCDPLRSTKLVLTNCPPALASCLSGGLENFFYPNHPRLGKLLCSNGRIAMYRANGDSGCIFYRNLKRGELAGIPLVFSISKSYVAIEKKIGADRDRKEFGSEIRGFFIKQIVDTLLREPEHQRKVLDACSGQWGQGNGNQLLQLMSGLSSYCLGTWDIFNDRYFASSKAPDNYSAKLQHDQVISQWKRDGRIELPGYFASFGAMTVEVHLKQLEEKAKQESMAQGRRAPSEPELAALGVLSECLALLSSSLGSFMKKTTVEYSIAKTEVLLGQFKAGRSYRSKEVFFSSQIFDMGFSQALALYLHEHSHIFGFDSSRGFTDALTNLLESTVQNRSQLDEMEREWKEASSRLKTFDPTKQTELAKQVAALPQDQLAKSLTKLKERVLQEMLTNLEQEPHPF